MSKTAMAEINWDHVVTEPEHLKELKAYCCDECGYTLFPARGEARVTYCLLEIVDVASIWMDVELESTSIRRKKRSVLLYLA